MERLLILATLSATAGNRTHAAQILGITVRTLRSKLAAYGLHQQQTRQPGPTRGGPEP